MAKYGNRWSIRGGPAFNGSTVEVGESAGNDVTKIFQRIEVFQQSPVSLSSATVAVGGLN